MKFKKSFLGMMIAGMLGGLALSEPVFAATPDAITPDGNLTLVDDFSGEETSGKQFITLVTKDGNYFYLIIDRDDDGKETVHFLNQVDASDLVALLDETEIEQLKEQVFPEETEEEVVLEIPEEILPEEPVEQTANKRNAPIGAIIVGILMGGGCLGFVFLKMKQKKQENKEEETDEDDPEEYYEFMDLEQELNEGGLDE